MMQVTCARPCSTGQRPTAGRPCGCRTMPRRPGSQSMKRNRDWWKLNCNLRVRLAATSEVDVNMVTLEAAPRLRDAVAFFGVRFLQVYLDRVIHAAPPTPHGKVSIGDARHKHGRPVRGGRGHPARAAPTAVTASSTPAASHALAAATAPSAAANSTTNPLSLPRNQKTGGQ
jgi:hypothetical protein